jgi:guanylate kinase
MDFLPSPLLIVISGPAGVGKDAVVACLKERGCPFHFVVTATDRPPRPGEVHGRDYFFYSTAEFERMEREGELLEHAVVYGQHKGIPKQQVRQAMASGKDVVMRLDVQGAATVRSLAPEAVLIFLYASPEELLQRMKRRGADSPEQIARRSEELAAEMAYLDIFDYVVVNAESKLHCAVDQVLSIIEAEHCRVHPRKVVL